MPKPTNEREGVVDLVNVAWRGIEGKRLYVGWKKWKDCGRSGSKY